MRKAVQQRTLETRARLIGMAQEMVNERGFEALRIDELVLRAGVAKGTFFAHFADKDELMDLLIGERINAQLDRMAAQKPPRTTDQVVTSLMPLLALMSAERYVFDVILRRSGSAALEEIGPIAETFERMGVVMGPWLALGEFRKDVPVELLVEGVQAMVIQTLALNFCAIHQRQPMKDRLRSYLRAWLNPVAA
ncbi:MAG: TetR/AcrR family transcriptional regulator [Burkholderiaceae bacterium]